MTDIVDTRRKTEIERLAHSSLRKFGLTDNEISVYIQALLNEELSPYLASKLTGIPRTTVYDIFMSLSLKGLIDLEQSTGFEKQQTRVRAKNPSVLRKILEEKRKETFDTETDLAMVLPLLKEQYHKDEANALVQFFPGIEGMKRVYLDLEIAEQEGYHESISWTCLMPLDILGNKVVNADVRRGSVARVKKGIKTKYLIPMNDWTKHVMTYQSSIDKDYLNVRDFRYIDSPFFNCYLELVMTNNVLKAACAEGDEVWGLVVRSKAFIATFRSIFQQQWQLAQPVTPELVESWGNNEFLREQQRKGQIKME